MSRAPHQSTVECDLTSLGTAESYSECKKFIKKLYEDVSNMMVKYAEQTGMIYDLEEAFSFETSVSGSLRRR